MDEQEFQRLLCLFPVVRSRDYHAESESSSQSTSKSGGNELKEWQDAWSEGDKGEYNAQDRFWEKLTLAAEKKVGVAESEKFCNAFRKVYQKLVYEGLSKEAKQQLLSSS